MQDRQTLHTLVDELPEPELPVAQRFLEYLGQQGRDPLREFLATVPEDDEPVSEEDRTAIRQGHEDRAKGEVMSQDEVVSRLRETG